MIMPAAAPKTATTPNAVASPVVAERPKLPDLMDSAVYRDAVDNLTRLRMQHLALERAVFDHQSRRAESADDKQRRLDAVVAGRSPGDVRRDESAAEADHKKAYQDYVLAGQAIAVAEQRLRALASAEKDAVTRPFAPHFRAKLRVAAVAFIAYAKAQAEVDEITDALSAADLLGRGGCESPLPGFRWGDPRRERTDLSAILRRLIDMGIIDPAADAGLLAGCQVDDPLPVPPSYATAPPPPANTVGQKLRAAGDHVRRLMGVRA